MKTRVTFRIAEELAQTLRTLPNQTEFVETTLRDALGAQCPVCQGSGRVRASQIQIPNWREANLPPLQRGSAMQLKALVQLARKLGVTRLEVAAHEEGLEVKLMREHEQLLQSTINDAHTQLIWH